MARHLRRPTKRGFFATLTYCIAAGHWPRSVNKAPKISQVKFDLFASLYSTSSRETHFQGAQVWHVLTRDHSFTCHPHVYPQLE